MHDVPGRTHPPTNPCPMTLPMPKQSKVKKSKGGIASSVISSNLSVRLFIIIPPPPILPTLMMATTWHSWRLFCCSPGFPPCCPPCCSPCVGPGAWRTGARTRCTGCLARRGRYATAAFRRGGTRGTSCGRCCFSVAGEGVNDRGEGERRQGERGRERDAPAYAMTCPPRPDGCRDAACRAAPDWCPGLAAAG
jgi:hypothetical protein